MASHTGTAAPTPTVSTIPTACIQRDVAQQIIVELQFVSRMLLESYLKKEAGVPECCKYRLPCTTSSPQLPDRINSSAILSYFQKIHSEEPEHKNLTLEVIEQLEKLHSPQEPGVTVSLPTNSVQRKCFFLAIFRQFSKCLELVPLKAARDNVWGTLSVEADCVGSYHFAWEGLRSSQAAVATLVETEGVHSECRALTGHFTLEIEVASDKPLLDSPLSSCFSAQMASPTGYTWTPLSGVLPSPRLPLGTTRYHCALNLVPGTGEKKTDPQLMSLHDRDRDCDPASKAETPAPNTPGPQASSPEGVWELLTKPPGARRCPMLHPDSGPRPGNGQTRFQERLGKGPGLRGQQPRRSLAKSRERQRRRPEGQPVTPRARTDLTLNFRPQTRRPEADPQYEDGKLDLEIKGQRLPEDRKAGSSGSTRTGSQGGARAPEGGEGRAGREHDDRKGVRGASTTTGSQGARGPEVRGHEHEDRNSEYKGETKPMFRDMKKHEAGRGRSGGPGLGQVPLVHFHQGALVAQCDSVCSALGCEVRGLDPGAPWKLMDRFEGPGLHGRCQRCDSEPGRGGRGTEPWLGELPAAGLEDRATADHGGETCGQARGQTDIRILDRRLLPGPVNKGDSGNHGLLHL
ncbi:PREDICTED: uncharacterized protein LOC102869092 [Elephantulus edwardii]|uniref:uncharacterized protein LOC102869092 n=1 Tax=Elephantulus edwardii TaxID=28737 RepID=UPI0003F0A003|nr:PREDICTED: uncharacterized protein LOC102869092 [Elephantulus edwardii]